MALSFDILGPLKVRENGRELPLGSGRQRALLALLIVHANELVPSERLIEELWSGRPPPTAQKAIQGYVSQLRRALGAETVLTRGSGYVLVAPVTDADEFERLTKLAGRQDPHQTILTLREASALWRGRAFEEFEYEEWPQLEIARLEELRLYAIEQRIEAELELGNHAQLVPELESLVAIQPQRERLLGHLMVALYRSGRHTDALDVYRRGRRVLHDELGLEPSPFLVKLEREILSHDPALAAPVRREVVVPLGEDDLQPRLGPPAAGHSRKPHRGRRRLLAGFVAAAVIAGVVLGAMALWGGGGSRPKVLPNSLIRIDPTTLAASQVASVGDRPDLIIASGGYIWITNNILRDSASSDIRNAGDHTLTRVDPRTGDAVVVGGGLAPCGLTADPSGDVWVANCFRPGTGQTSNVVRVDSTTLTFKQTLVVPGGNHFFRGLAYGGGVLWLANQPGSSPYVPTITELDPRTRSAEAIRIEYRPGALAWSGGYGDLWISNFDDGALTRLHAATGALQTVDSVGTNPGPGMIVDGSTVWVGDWSSAVVIRTSATGSSPPRSVRLPVHNRFGCPHTSCVWSIAAGAGAIWATTPEDRALWRIDSKSNEVTRIRLPYPPAGVAADAT